MLEVDIDAGPITLFTDFNPVFIALEFAHITP